ncbi:imidazolonepropionase [Oligoflexus tunisiensis]|uniref:imidazolonepropionase n=1 Tax=Oligoflexus tunisiensis TaxID=708132 RepID=UPI000ABC62AD|nr:imidazolonepropionase [Oligoflexus tunisiensis]
MAQLLIKNCGQLVTLAPLATEKRYIRITPDDLGVIAHGWLAIADGKIQDMGGGAIPERFERWPQLDARGALVTPGLIDCHTHPIFGGDRTHEFAMRLSGSTYQEIAARGGGIKYSIRSTRAADDHQLMQKCLSQLWVFLRNGVTTVEAKTGYGQSVAEELRLLRVLRQVGAASPQTVVVTCLALHDLPTDIPDKSSYVQAMRDELLPELARTGLADWVDAFVEDGYFSVADAESFAQKALSLGLKLRVHADEFNDSGAAFAAARWGAASADHVQAASDTGIRAMAEAGTVAVLLPGTSFYTKIAYAKASRYRDADCPIAVASDFNPGSCFIGNLPFAASLAALYCGMSAAEALVAVTWNAARALRLEEHKGAFMPGYDADVVVHGVNSVEQWIAHFGQTKPKEVVIGGMRLT